MNSKRENSGQERGGQESGEMSEAEIDQNLEDTFPASDPPSWTLGTDHQSAVRPPDGSADDREAVDDQDQQFRKRG